MSKPGTLRQEYERLRDEFNGRQAYLEKWPNASMGYDLGVGMLHALEDAADDSEREQWFARIYKHENHVMCATRYVGLFASGEAAAEWCQKNAPSASYGRLVAPGEYKNGCDRD